MLIVAFALHCTKFRTVGVRIFSKIIHDVGVIPASARFSFLGSEHISCVRNKNVRGFKGTHKAGVKADKFELIGHLVIYRVQSIVYFAERKTVAVVELVKANAAYASAAMIPENKSHTLCRVVFNAP